MVGERELGWVQKMLTREARDTPFASQPPSNTLELFELFACSAPLAALVPCRDSPMYFLNTFSICFWLNRPLNTNLWAPSIDPWVPNSAYKNINTCSGCLCIRRQMSTKLANDVFFVPSRLTIGGTIVYLFLSPASSGLLTCSKV